MTPPLFSLSCSCSCLAADVSTLRYRGDQIDSTECANLTNVAMTDSALHTDASLSTHRKLYLVKKSVASAYQDQTGKSTLFFFFSFLPRLIMTMSPQNSVSKRPKTSWPLLNKRPKSISAIAPVTLNHHPYRHVSLTRCSVNPSGPTVSASNGSSGTFVN